MDLGFSYLSKKEKENILKGIINQSVYTGPLHIEIHPTDRCTTRCFFCSTRWRREKSEIPLEILSSIIEQLKLLGTKSILLSGGGDPLSHIQKEKLIEKIGYSNIKLFNVTTNGVGLNKIIREMLINFQCQQIIVSLNCSDEKSYSEMMMVGPKVFNYVKDNIQSLIEERGKNKFPKLILQFLVYKKNYKTIPNMYQLAKELKADGILFNGLSFLSNDLKMEKNETEEMVKLYFEILKIDEYRKILGINSFEQDIAEKILRVEKLVGDLRSSRNIIKKIFDFFNLDGYSLKEKLNHRKKMKLRRNVSNFLKKGMDPCIRPWYAMTIRSDGKIPICCVRQHIIMGNIYENNIKEIWEGENFSRYRKQMSKVILTGKNYFKKEEDNFISNACLLSSIGFNSCPFRSYYRYDIKFMKKLAKLIIC